MKKKILAIVLCVAMLAIAIVGGTMAYFTDTKAQTNTFTAGKVEIGLDEAVVEKDTNGNYVSTGERTHNDQDYHLYPGMFVDKDPTISVLKGSEDAYVAAKITVTSGAEGDIERLIYSTGNYGHLIDVSKIIAGGIAQPGATMKTDHVLYNLNGSGLPVYGDDTYSAYQEVFVDGGVNGNGEYIIYVFFENPMKEGESVTLFEQMTIPTYWDNGEMAIMNGTTIKVEAYATQTNGFHNCYDAIIAAFGGEGGAFATVAVSQPD